MISSCCVFAEISFLHFDSSDPQAFPFSRERGWGNINNIKYMWQKATVGYLSIVVLFKIIKLNFIILKVTEFNIRNVTKLNIA